MKFSGQILEIGITNTYDYQGIDGQAKQIVNTPVKVGDSANSMFFDMFGDRDTLDSRGIIVGSWGDMEYSCEARVARSGRCFNQIKNARWRPKRQVEPVAGTMNAAPEPMPYMAPDGKIF